MSVVRYVGDRLVCELCGRDYENLAIHVWQAHGLLANDYKAMHGLPRRTALWSDRLRELDRRRAQRLNAERRMTPFDKGHGPRTLSPEHRAKIGRGRAEYLASHPDAYARMAAIGRVGGSR